MNSSPLSQDAESKTISPITRAPCLIVLLLVAAVGIIFIIATFIFPRPKIPFSNFGGSQYGTYKINANFTTITADDGEYWQIEYEKKTSSQFSGKIRHISSIDIPVFPILTHDVLVTSMDFADPLKVNTSVSNHHFFWVSLTRVQPQGTINLLHTLPKNDEIYQKLLQIQPDELVTISGWEIMRINAYQANGTLTQWWQDAGCNTILVDFVSAETDP